MAATIGQLARSTGIEIFSLPVKGSTTITIGKGVEQDANGFAIAGTTSGLTTIDINEGGSTILSTKITIDLTETTSVTAATQPVISDASLADDAQISIDLDAISGGASETGLKVTLIGHQTP